MSTEMDDLRKELAECKAKAEAAQDPEERAAYKERVWRLEQVIHPISLASPIASRPNARLRKYRKQKGMLNKQ